MSEPNRIFVESDLDSQGRLGSTTLVIENGKAVRTEETAVGKETIAEYEVSDLKNPRLEDLVDSTALIADIDGHSVELIRATNRKSLPLANAEKQLKALVDGKPMPSIDNETRVCPKCGRPLPQYNNVCEACVHRGKTLLRLFGYTKPFKLRMIWGCFLSIGVRIVTLVVQIARGRNIGYLSAKIAVAIRHSLFEKLQELSLGFYDKRNVGSLMSRMTNDTGALYDVLVDGIPVLLNQMVIVIGIPIIMMSINLKIGLMAMIPVPFVVVAVHFFRKKMNRVWSRFWHQWSRTGATLNGILQGTRVVKAFFGEDREIKRFNRRITDLAQSGYVAEASWATFFPVVMFSMSIGIITVWGAGAACNLLELHAAFE
jgi:ATP-binding cassette, subfamily B, bacterial